MRPEFVQAEHRRLPQVLGVPGWLRWLSLWCTVTLGALLCISTAQAQDPDRALLPLQPAPTVPAVRNAPVLKLEWQHRLRNANSLGPPPLRPVDAALLAAARGARWAEVQRLLKPEAGTGPPAHANASDEAGGHALVLAAAAGQLAVLRDLLQHGADIERSGEHGFNALGAAAFQGQHQAVRLLLQAGADPARWGAGGHTALHLAAATGQVGVIQTLLRANVPIDLLNRQRETALDVAGAANQAEAMDLLIQGGADLTMAGRR